MIHYNADRASNIGVCGELGVTTDYIGGVECPRCITTRQVGFALTQADSIEKENAALKARIDELEALLRWTALPSDTPLQTGQYLVVFVAGDGKQHVIAAKHRADLGRWFDAGGYERFPTHYMPIPKAPEVKP